MEEEILNNSIEEVVPQESETDSQQQKPASNVVDDVNERNWRALRERKKELERDLQMQREINEKLMLMAKAAEPKAPVEIDELDSISDDDYVPKGKSKKLVRKEIDPLKKEIEELKAQLQHREKREQFISLKQKYADFDEVVNQETMALLEQKEPELAETIADLKDPYKIAVQTYKYIKALGLKDNLTEHRRIKEVDEKLKRNANTIQSPLASEKRPMAQAFKLTEQEKSKLYEEMTGYARLASSVPELG